nr:MAG TPA: hypothetical protein [Caudoviricetes sp.]
MNISPFYLFFGCHRRPSFIVYLITEKLSIDFLMLF